VTKSLQCCWSNGLEGRQDSHRPQTKAKKATLTSTKIIAAAIHYYHITAAASYIDVREDVSTQTTAL